MKMRKLQIRQFTWWVVSFVGITCGLAPSHAECQDQLRVLALRDQLASSSIEDRQAAIRKLAELEGHAAPAADALIELIADPKVGPDVQRALVAIGPTTLLALADNIEHADAARRVAALGGIKVFGRYGRRVQTQVISALDDTEDTVQLAALQTLSRIDATDSELVPRLIGLLTHKDAERRALAATALAGMGLRAQRAIPELTKTLQDVSPRVRARAADALGRMGPLARPALPALSALFADEDLDVWQAAASAVANTWGHPGGEALVEPIPTLMTCLESESANVRNAALRACSLLSAFVVHNNLPYAVVKRLTDEDSLVLQQALRVVAETQLNERHVADAVCLLAEHQDSQVRFLAFQALAVLQPPSERGKAVILAGLRHSEPSTRRAAVEAAPHVCPGDDDAIAALLAMLNKRQDFGEMLGSTQIVAQSLGSMGNKVVVPLMRRLNDEDLDSRFGAIDTLGNLGRIAKPALPSLIRILDEKDVSSYHRSIVLHAIHGIGIGDNKQIARAIGKLVNDQDPYVRENAIRILATADKQLWPAVVADVTKGLDDEERDVVHAAIVALGPFGSAAEPVALKLAELAERRDDGFIALAALKSQWQAF